MQDVSTAAADRTAALAGARVLVTGGTGFLGRRVVARLLGDGAQVTVLARNARRASGLTAQGVQVAPGDMASGAGLEAAVAGQGVVINLAHDFRAPMAANMAGFQALTAACVKAGVERFVAARDELGAAPAEHLHEQDARFERGQRRSAQQRLGGNGLAHVGSVPNPHRRARRVARPDARRRARRSVRRDRRP